MGPFKRKPKCEVCTLRDRHDHGMHLQAAYKTAAQIKRLRNSEDAKLAELVPAAGDIDLLPALAESRMFMQEQADILGWDDDTVANVINTATV